MAGVSDPAALQVIILRDGLLVGTEAFVPGTFLLGSGPDSDLRLEDPSVAGQHAILFFQNGRAAIQQSQGAVLVNGHPVRACEVRPVDEIAIGPFTLKLRLLAKRASAPKPAPAPELSQLLGGSAPARPGPHAVPSPPQPARPPPPPRVPGIPPVAPLAQPLAQTAVARRVELSPPAVAPLSPPLAAVPTGTAIFGQNAHEEVTRPSFQPSHVTTPANTAVTMPSARVIGNQVVEQALPKRVDSLPDFQVDTGPFRIPPPAAPAPRPRTLAPAKPRGPWRTRKRAKSSTPLMPRREGFSVPPGRGKGKPRLYLELFWGDAQQASVCVRRDKKPFTLGPPTGKLARFKQRNPFELFGFAIPPEGFHLAESDGDRFRVYVPMGAKVERLREDGTFTAAKANEVARAGRAHVSLGAGEAARFTPDGKIFLRAYVAPPPERFFGNPFKGVPWLALFLLCLVGGAILHFAIKYAPVDSPDFKAQDLQPVALRLLTVKKPPKKKVEKPKPAEDKKPKEEKKPEVAEKPKPKPRPVARAVPKPEPKVEQPPAPEVKALKALQKLSAAGPAMHDMLAAVDKLGNGPGSKHAKAVNYKLSGLVGKAPIATAGLGNFGLGGGGKGGIGTLGAELLHGKGGGGIGAMGAGSVGHGKIGGTVSRATARKVSAQGNIDRDAVARTVNQHLQEVRACYERQLLKDPGLAGKVVLEWTISTSGLVVQAKTKTSTLNNATVESCILSSLKTWHFPSARGGLVIVSYPFLFNAVGY